MPLTGIVLTLNEERHLPDCLESLMAVTDDVIVVDSASTDRTVDIATSAGARVVDLPFQGYASQRNNALAMAEGEWVLFLDADERLTPELQREIQGVISSANADVAGFWIPRRNIVCGKGLVGGGWWPDYQARLMRKGLGSYDPEREVHEVVVFEGQTLRLKSPMLHINYESVPEILNRQRQYTVRQVRAGLVPPPRPVSYVSRPLREFYRRFISLNGYRDGLIGLMMASVMALEEFRGCLLTRRGERI